jgi:iron complex transport system ATP-binding protein
MNATTAPLLSCNRLSVDVPSRRLVESLSFELQRGELIAILGQNGAGKSMTLATLAGLRDAASGSVSLCGRNIFESARQWVAQHLALLPQSVDDIFPATALDTAMIGRHPHIGRLSWESAEDMDIAMTALESMGLGALASRNILSLSGGERQRLAVAQVLAQSPDVYLLDEPSNHLDPHHQVDAIQIFRNAARRGAGIMASFHDVNLAARFADRCLLLFGDGRWQLGPSAQMLTADSLSELFATRMEAVPWHDRYLFVAASGHEPA